MSTIIVFAPIDLMRDEAYRQLDILKEVATPDARSYVEHFEAVVRSSIVTEDAPPLTWTECELVDRLYTSQQH